MLVDHPDRGGTTSDFHRLTVAFETIRNAISTRRLILEPTLEQAYNGCFYVLKEDGETHHVPLWVGEYQSKGLNVILQPILPSHITLESNRDLNIWIRMDRPKSPICLRVLGNDLIIPDTNRNRPFSRHIYYGCGFPTPNQTDILEKIQRTNLVINLTFK